MAWDEEGVCCFGSNAEKLVPTVKSGGTGEAGTGGAAGGERGKLVEIGCQRKRLTGGSVEKFTRYSSKSSAQNGKSCSN